MCMISDKVFLSVFILREMDVEDKKYSCARIKDELEEMRGGDVGEEGKQKFFAWKCFFFFSEKKEETF